MTMMPTWHSDRVRLGSRPRPPTAAIKGVLGLVVVVSACAPATGRGSSPGRTTRSTVAPSTTTVPTGPVPPVAWSPCGDDLQCGSVAVPLDYARPRGATVRIALERRPASDPSQRIGSLVINPGGPGTSGIDDLPNELGVLTPELLERFDIVSFDPRGVERSDPLTCSPGGPGSSGSSASSSPGPLPDPVPATTAAERALVAGDRAYAAACQKYSGALLPFVGTVDVARDLDRIRAALGDARLTFIGHSYGTLIGALYAQMYPDHVRAMVLDGAIDPALGTEQMVLDQATGFESVLDQFFSWCASTEACPWRTGPDPTAALTALIDRSRTTPLPASGGRSAGPGEFYDALLDDLYAPSSWPSLGDALAQAAEGGGSDLVSLADTYASGGSTNGGDVNNAVNCLDHPVGRDPTAYGALASRAAASAPVFGPLLVWGLVQCAVWPVLPTRVPGPVTAAGSPPILVVGTTGDPATPYRWAVALAHQLQHGELLTWEGTSHVAYFYSACVRAYDQAYLVSGTLPPPGTTCTD
jgi:pimeloyl-ACP methyl ester carboxylesterase